MSFRVPSIYNETHPDALAFYCSDGRFTRAVEELLLELGHDRLDTLTMPGAAGLIDPNGSARLADTSAVRRALSFLIEGHAIRSVILIAHQGCGYYKHRFPSETPEAIRARQNADLRNAAAWLKETHPGVRTSLHFAQIEDEHVLFLPVA
jgi:carbonic anhydrase